MPNTHVPAAGEAMPSKSTIFLAITPRLRLQLATTIENLIALLDEIDGDPDLEADGDDEVDASDDEDGHDAEPTLGAPNDHNGDRNQTWFYQGSTLHDECEDENEHGGDILDERHDEEDLEPFLGWTEKCGQTGVGLDDFSGDDEGADDPLRLIGFDGSGHAQGREMLRRIGGLPSEELVRVLCLPARR